mmetsp:Transcript_81109/g.180247  ORF Transcript_81109/g.180247 Transcript_81109/m.180247 type:complete len:203 (-) Transcript_81109:3-611(-)
MGRAPNSMGGKTGRPLSKLRTCNSRPSIATAAKPPSTARRSTRACTGYSQSGVACPALDVEVRLRPWTRDEEPPAISGQLRPPRTRTSQRPVESQAQPPSAGISATPTSAGPAGGASGGGAAFGKQLGDVPATTGVAGPLGGSATGGSVPWLATTAPPATTGVSWTRFRFLGSRPVASAASAAAIAAPTPRSRRELRYAQAS